VLLFVRKGAGVMYTKSMAVSNAIIKNDPAMLAAAILNAIKGKEISIQTISAINRIIEGLQLANTIQELMAYAQIHCLRLQNEPDGLALYAFYLKEIKQYIVFSLRSPEQKLPEPDISLYSAIEIKPSWYNAKVRFKLDVHESLRLSFGEGYYVNLHAKQIKLQNSNLSRRQKEEEQVKILDAAREANLKWEIIQTAKNLENLQQEFPEADHAKLSPTISELKIKLDTDSKYYIRLLWNAAPKKDEQHIVGLSFEESVKHDRQHIKSKLIFSDRETKNLFINGHANFQGFSINNALELMDLLNEHTSWDNFRAAVIKKFPSSKPEQVRINGKLLYSVRINSCVRLLFDIPQAGGYAANVHIHMNYHDLLD
jgi:plasmid maintenance system killer protein